MKQNPLRFAIFSMWASCLVLTILAVQLGPVLRRDGTIGYGQLSPFLVQIIGLFVPPLSCLAGFWFPSDERQKAQSQKLDKHRAGAAIVLTLGYLVIVLASICWPIYLTTYSATLEMVKGESLAERLADAMKVATLLSPLALAPIHFLTSSLPSKGA